MIHQTLTNVIYFLILQSFPESLVMVLATFSFLKLCLWDKRILFIAVLQTLTNLVQLLPIAFGMHTVVLILSLTIYTRLFTRARMSKIFIAIFVCFAVIATSQMLYTTPLLNLIHMKYETVYASPVLSAAFSIPYELLLLALALFIDNYNRKKGNLNN